MGCSFFIFPLRCAWARHAVFTLLSSVLALLSVHALAADTREEAPPLEIAAPMTSAATVDEELRATTRPSPEVTIGEGGLRIRSEDGRYSFGARAFGQFTYNQALADEEEIYGNGFKLRTLRPTFLFGVSRYAELQLTLDILATGVRAYDAFIALNIHPRVVLRVGLQRTLLNAEMIQSPTSTLFLERSMVSTLSPYRDLGVSLDAELAPGLRLEVGMFNGADNTEVFQGTKASPPEFQARLQFLPLTWLQGPPETMELRLGVAANHGLLRGHLNETRLVVPRSAGGRGYLAYAPGVFADGPRTRATAFVQFSHRGLYLLAEYLFTQQGVATPNGRETLRIDAWQLAASYAFGGQNTWTGVKPDVEVFEGGLGALQLKLRFHQTRFSNAGGGVFTDRVNATGTTVTSTLSAGISWWLSRHLRVQGDYSWTQFRNESRATSFEDEHLLQFSTTLVF